jgi:hypothetical protein
VNPGAVEDLKKDAQLFYNGIAPNMFCFDIRSLLAIHQNDVTMLHHGNDFLHKAVIIIIHF